MLPNACSHLMNHYLFCNTARVTVERRGGPDYPKNDCKFKFTVETMPVFPMPLQAHGSHGSDSHALSDCVAVSRLQGQASSSVASHAFSVFFIASTQVLDFWSSPATVESPSPSMSLCKAP